MFNDVQWFLFYFILILQYLDVIFEAILPEWAFEIFCKKFDCTRLEALERLHVQATAWANQSDSEML